MTAVAACRTCGTEFAQKARFCHGCGSPIETAPIGAEYKQVTVLFADVVNSMNIASSVGAERLREIVVDLTDRCAAMVHRYGGTVDKFTGDGIMAVFGAPTTLEDHAVRACLAALGVQEETKRLAVDVLERDGVDLYLRVGLNSGEVIVGEIGSRPFSYTAIGHHVGMAQRMESAAPLGGVMLSTSTARLVEGTARLSDAVLVQIKGADVPVSAHVLLGVSDQDRRTPVAESALVGRRSELAVAGGLLKSAVEGQGSVVTLTGPPGIGKSRLVREIAKIATNLGVETFAGYCESHTSDIHFRVVAKLLRAATGVGGMDASAARQHVRARAPGVDFEDVGLLEDLLGIADPDVTAAMIDPDARRRRLTTLVNAALMARKSPALYVIEDAHWIDEVSESMLTDFFAVIPQSHSLVLVTYRPEYRGALRSLAGANTIDLEPLSDSETCALVSQLLGPDPSIGALNTVIAERATGNPFFVEEIVRDLAERAVLHGARGAFVSTADAADVTVPATVQATLGARIDRLHPRAKRTLQAAAVIGATFSRDLLVTLGVDPVLEDLMDVELIDQIRPAPKPAYVFHHPLIRMVAYDSQLKSDRAALHRRLATAIEADDTASPDANAALIAEHLTAAGEQHAAYDWLMRAAVWATNRDIAAARLSWERALTIADALPVADPSRTAMRITPRTMLCGTGWRISTLAATDHFTELAKLCGAAGDKASLGIATAGLVVSCAHQDRVREASRLASDAWAIAESVGDWTLTVGLSFPVTFGKIENADWSEVLQWSQTVIDLADGDPSAGNFLVGCPLALACTARGMARYFFGQRGWWEDLRHGMEMGSRADPASYAGTVGYVYLLGIPFGAVTPDDSALNEIENALRIAERSSDDVVVSFIRATLGVALVHRETTLDRRRGQQLLTDVGKGLRNKGHNLCDLPLLEVYSAREAAREGRHDIAIPAIRAATDHLFRYGRPLLWGLPATGVLVESLLDRGSTGDVAEADSAIDRLASATADVNMPMRDVWLLRLRALLARAQGNAASYTRMRDDYRRMAKTVGYQGHTSFAEAMQ